MDNLFDLQKSLSDKTYVHGTYQAFNISDPKPRNIHKATVRDRLFHYLLYNSLYPYFDQKFIYDSYSCRCGKGTHRAVRRFNCFYNKVSKNNTKQCFVLKCDIRKFFASIDHAILKNILAKHIKEKDTLWLLGQVIDSFHTISAPSDTLENLKIAYIRDSVYMHKGLPLGNLTSQILVNIYMNEFDHFVKRELKEKYYIRYADDFVILQNDKMKLEELLPKIADFLENKLKLSLHPNKVFIKTYSSGLDFLGWVNFPKHRVLRTATKKRMFRNLEINEYKEESLSSYSGLLLHGNAFKLKQKIEEGNLDEALVNL